MQIKIFIPAIILAFQAFSLFGQAVTDGSMKNLSAEIVSKGYENVRVIRENDTIFLGVENRVWRWEPRAAAELLKTIMPYADSGSVVSLTLLRSGIPATTLIVSRKQYDDLVAGRISADLFSNSMTALLSDRIYRKSAGHVRPLKPSFNKFDIVVFPQLKVQFGNFVHPLEIQFNVAPAVNINFFKGLSLTAQVIFPVYSNLIGDPEASTIRPGLIVLGQTFRLPYQIFTTVSAGYFTRNRYGLNAEARKFLFNGRMSVGASLGYTGQMQLLEGWFTYTPMNVITWFCDASWRFPGYDLTIRGGYGRFIGQDEGWRVDVSRRFGEVSVGFFAMNTSGITNGGFNFIVPLPPRKFGTKNRIRIRPAPYIPWEYRAKGLPSMGRTYVTGNGTEELMFNLNPDYIRKQLGKDIQNN